MKYLSTLVFGIFIALSSFGQFNMPPFEDVVRTFYATYSFDNRESYLKFQRKKDGWFVSEDSYSNPGHYFNTRLFWSKEMETYIELNYPPANTDTSLISENVNKYLTQINWNQDAYPYQRNKYYGYPGWDWDVIIEDSSLSNLSDYQLESKARAYFNYASGFIAEQFGDVFVNNDINRTPLKANEKISTSRIDKFLYYELKAINAYSEILRMNPDYDTRVGNIKIKLANEYVFSYLELMMAGDTKKANEFIRKAEYPDSLIALSNSYLSKLPLNSILITGGDNDTYPLWYLQKVKNFRPDISVLNYSLISFRRYLYFINQDQKQRLFSTRDSTYLKDNFVYSIFSNDTDTNIQINITAFLSNLEKHYNPYATTSYSFNGENLKTYYAKTLFFETGNKRKGKLFQIGDYLLMNEYILLDIINTSKTRKVFFTFEVDLLSSLLTLNGNIYELKY